MKFASWRHRTECAHRRVHRARRRVGGTHRHHRPRSSARSRRSPPRPSSRDAWANDADIVLGADITLTCFEKSDPGGSEAVRDLAGAGTLDGQGHTITQTCPETRVLQITGETGGVGLRNVTVTGGQAVFGTFSGNGGGGIQSTVESQLNIIDSTFTGNTTCEGGGGIEMDYSGPITVTGLPPSRTTPRSTAAASPSTAPRPPW